MGAVPQRRYISPLKDAIDSWLEFRPKNTVRQYQRIFARWSAHLGTEICQPESLKIWVGATVRDAQKYMGKLRSRSAQPGRSAQASADGKVSGATLHYTALVLRTAYEELISQGIADLNPWTKIAKDLRKHRTGQRRPHKLMPIDLVRKFLDIKPRTLEDLRDRAVFHLLFGAALRRSEVTSLRVGDIQYTPNGTCFLRLPITKSGNAQLLPIADWVARAVEDLAQSRRSEGAGSSDPLFVRYLSRGRRPAWDDMAIYRLFKAYLETFGESEAYTPHCARVTAITRLLDQGLSHREVQELSRHSSVMMVEKYDRRRVDIDASPAKKLRFE